MAKPLFPKSARKHIRIQKAKIRREVSDSQKQQELIELLCKRFEKPQKKEESAPPAKET